MISINKLLGLAGLGGTLANVVLLKRFIAGVTIVIALTAISSTLVGLLIAGAFYGFYLSLMHYGLDRPAAVIAVSSLAIIVTVWLITLAVIRWRQLQDMPHSIFPEAPIVGKAGRMASAFVDGLMERSRHT